MCYDPDLPEVSLMKFINLFAILLLTIAASASAADFYTVNVESDSYLNLRSRPKKSARTVVELGRGTCVQSLGETANADGYDWVKVKTSGDKTGWAAAKYLTASPAGCFTSEPPAPPARAAAPAQAGVVPILHYNNLLGGIAGGKWRGAGALFPMVKANTPVRFYNLIGSLGPGTISYLYQGEVCEVDAQLTGEPDTGEMYFGVGGDWDAMPRAPLPLDARQTTYADDIRRLLDERGLGSAPVAMDQLLRIDLEGDGQEEAFFSATNMPDQVNMADGHYTMIVMRKIINGNVRAFVLDEQNFLSAPGELPLTCRIAAFLDTDGDGVIEVLTTCDYYEGGTVYIHKIQDGIISTPLASSCGV
jgi:hypothetical protein